eukprot:6731381-Prymnesium_polylepis.1
MSLPISGCARWYDVMSESNVMVLPVPVGISSIEWPLASSERFSSSMYAYCSGSARAAHTGRVAWDRHAGERCRGASWSGCGSGRSHRSAGRGTAPRAPRP